jgi:indolepyruvate ferredoxin oxidoreductase, alpha subunit
VRLVTRIAHQRAEVTTDEPRAENPLRTARTRADWVLLPEFARAHRRRRLNDQSLIQTWSETSAHNHLTLNPSFRDLGVITTGLGRSYFHEAVSELGLKPSHLHIGAYPVPVSQVQQLFEYAGEILVIEEGYPFVERLLRGILLPTKPIRGKQTSDLPPDGELTEDAVRQALGLPLAPGVTFEDVKLPARPPRLCDGCPHIDAYKALDRALAGFASRIVTSDIGCYTLGILPPYEVGDSCVCMGASIGMAKGAAEAGIYPAVAVIGDSTFLHSGVPPLIDAVARNVDMTVLILDNGVSAMTGAQPTILPSPDLVNIVLGLGISPEHCCVVESHPRKVDEIAEILKREIEHHGLSVVIARRECLDAVRNRKKP